MSLEIDITLGPKARRVLEEVGEMTPRMREAMRAEMDRQNELTVSQIQSGHLTGRGPNSLKVRSGRLRQSARRNDAKIVGQAVVSAIGTNVRYAAAHEFGSTETGTSNVRAFIRRSRGRDTYDAKHRKVSSGIVRVRPFTRRWRQNIKATAPFSTGIKDRIDKYGPALGRAIVAAWNGGQP